MIQSMGKHDEEVREPKPLTRIIVVAAGIAVASALHYFTPPSLILWHNLFQRLYYLPIIYAAIYFGWRGGLVASTASAVCYIPHSACLAPHARLRHEPVRGDHRVLFGGHRHRCARR